MRAPWVKWSPVDFLNGVVGLDAPTIGIYAVILNMIYDNGGPIRWDGDAKEKIARRVGWRIDRFEKCLGALIKDGKLVAADGVLSNRRADQEITKRAANYTKRVSTLSENVSKAGKNINKNNEPKTAIETIIVHSDGVEEKRREENPPLPPRGNAAPRPPRPASAAPKAERMDKNRKISAANVTYASSRGLNRKEIEREWAMFTRYYATKPNSDRNSKSTDWDTVWETWVIRACDRLGREPYADAAAAPAPAETSRKTWETWADIYRNTGKWHDGLGPEPGHPGCMMPDDLVSQVVTHS